MRRHGWRTLASTAAAVALGALGYSTPMASASTIPAVGLNDLRSDGILLRNLQYDGGRDLDLLAGSGIGLYRARVRMDCVEKADGSFDFKTPSAACWGISYDALVKSLAQRNIELLPALMRFKRVAGSEVPSAPTADGADNTPTYDRFAAFAGAAARRYGAGGTFWTECGCPAKPIRSWEVWNESNNGWWWNGHASADAYAETYARARAALRAADPEARAVVGGLIWDRNGEASFVEPDVMIERLARDDANGFDAVAIHPYTDARGRDGETLAADALAFTRLMADTLIRTTGPDADGRPRQPIWLTEMGWSTSDGNPQAIADGVTAFTAALDAGARDKLNVGPILWFMLRDTHVLAQRDDQLGLRRTTPMGADAGPKPAWEPFVAAAQRTPALVLPAVLRPAGPYVPPAAAPAPVADAIAPAKAKNLVPGKKAAKAKKHKKKAKKAKVAKKKRKKKASKRKTKSAKRGTKRTVRKATKRASRR